MHLETSVDWCDQGGTHWTLRYVSRDQLKCIEKKEWKTLNRRAKKSRTIVYILWKLLVLSCPTLADMDCSLPGSSVYGILQKRILEWVAISFSRGSSWPRNWIQVSCIAGRFFTDWAMRKAHMWKYQETKETDVMTEIMVADNFIKSTTDIKLQIQGAKRTPNRINAKKPLYPGISYANCRRSKTEKTLKRTEGKTTLPIEAQRPGLHLSVLRNHRNKRVEWNSHCAQRKTAKEIHIQWNKQNPRAFVACRPALQEMLFIYACISFWLCWVFLTVRAFL